MELTLREEYWIKFCMKLIAVICIDIKIIIIDIDKIHICRHLPHLSVVLLAFTGYSNLLRNWRA
jgi:hypothetical protein